MAITQQQCQQEYTNAKDAIEGFNTKKTDFFLQIKKYKGWVKTFDVKDKTIKKGKIKQKDIEIKRLQTEIMRLKSDIEDLVNNKPSNFRNKIMTNKGLIQKKNNEILQKRKEKQDLQKEIIIFPKTSFAEKVMTSQKVDSTKYLTKIDPLNTFFSDSLNFIAPKYNENDLTNKLKLLNKIKERFNRVKIFSINYCRELDYVMSEMVMGRWRHGKDLRLKKLEQQEMTASLKEPKDLYKLLVQETNQLKVKSLATKGVAVTTSALTTPNSVFDARQTPYNLKTPFGDIDVKVDQTGNIMIHPKGKLAAPTYDAMALKLDSLFTGDPIPFGAIITNVIQPIINYLKQTSVLVRATVRNQNLLDKITAINNTYITDPKIKDAAATLCGILMLSESHQFRNPTLAKLERNAMKTVKLLAEKNYDKPFGKVFANKTGRYIPAHDNTSDGIEEDLQKGTVDGGQKQMRMLLGYEMIGDDVAIKISNLPNLFKIQKKDDIVSNIQGIWEQIEDLKLPPLALGKRRHHPSYIKKSITVRECENKLKGADVISNKDLFKKYQLLKFQIEIDSKKKTGNLVKINDLPDNRTYDIFDFGGGVKNTPKQFFEDQFNKNLRKIYKSQNRTITKKMIKELLK